MEFWNSLLTEKSWKIMQKLKKENFRFIVIGGWAAYLWTSQHKSKDIDIIIPDFKTLELLNKKYSINKIDNLKKYEIKIEEIDIDIYLPYYSKLTPPAEKVIKHTSKIKGFEVAEAEILLLLKQGAELDRKESIKGQKDRIDIITLLIYSKIDPKKYQSMLSEYSLNNFKQRLKEIILSFRDIKNLNLNQNEYSKIKKNLLKNFF
ncbi:hypothetical protein HY498_01725 [Candidatus Woesearchaeota archaeon]|nr:hypothetical protein [Candidatus Woesearchaeota archaeon]